MPGPDDLPEELHEPTLRFYAKAERLVVEAEAAGVPPDTIVTALFGTALGLAKRYGTGKAARSAMLKEASKALR